MESGSVSERKTINEEKGSEKKNESSFKHWYERNVYLALISNVYISVFKSVRIFMFLYTENYKFLQ